MLSLGDAEDHSHLGEKGVFLAAKVAGRVEPQRPARRALDVAKDVLERVHGHLARAGGGGVREPDLDAAVVVGLRLKDPVRAGRVAVVGGFGAVELELDAHAAGRLALGGVEDVARYAVFFLGRHFGLVVCRLGWGWGFYVFG